MKILLDTHCWLWWLVSPERLSEKSLQILKDSDNTIFLSAASSWEIAIKYAIGKLSLPEHPMDFVPKRLARDNISSLAVEHVHALHVSTLPAHHRDPFDRLLISQAQIENLSIMTVDSTMELYDVGIIRADMF